MRIRAALVLLLGAIFLPPALEAQDPASTAPVLKEGEVILGGRVRKFLLVDGDDDQRFATPGTDALYLDLDGDGELYRGLGSHERVRPGRPFWLARAGYLAEISDSGDLAFRLVEEAPDPAQRPWPHRQSPRAGREPDPGVGTFAEEKEQYRLAEEADRKSGLSETAARVRVIGRIGRTGDPEAFRFLLDLATRALSLTLRCQAIRATAFGCYGSLAPGMVALALGEEDLRVRLEAIQALHGMDAPDRVPVFTSVLRTAKLDSLYLSAARCLAYTGSDEAYAVLERQAGEHPLPRYRFLAYQALTDYRRTPPPTEVIVSAACSPYTALRCLGLSHAGILDLPEATQLGISALSEGDPVVRLAGIRLLATRDDPDAVTALIHAATAQPDRMRKEMIRLLAPVRREEIIALFRLGLAAEAPSTRCFAIEVLAAIRTDEAVEELLAQLDREKDAEPVALLIRSLGPGASTDVLARIIAAVNRLKEEPEVYASALTALAQCGASDAAVRSYFGKAVGDRNVKRRIAVLDAVAEAGGEAWTELLIESLRGGAWQVRLTAVEGLGRVRSRRGVVPLIERLGRERVPRIVAAIADSLYRITGQNFYDLVELWEKWWEEEGDSFEVPSKVPEVWPEPVGGRTTATFYDIPVESDRLILVMDRSGSMELRSKGGTRWKVAVEQALAVVDSLDRHSNLNLILFNNAIDAWQKKLTRMDLGNRAALRMYLLSRKPEGGTNLYDGLELALLAREVDTVFLLSDGIPSDGKFVQASAILQEVKKINRFRKVRIHCVSIGADSALLRDLADQNRGRYVWYR
jgi:HEAT repeat protein